MDMYWLYHFRSNKRRKQSELLDLIIAQQESDRQETERVHKVKRIEQALSKTANTPDVADLSNKTGAILFVYNDLMKKRKDCSLLEDAQFAGDAYTTFEVNCWYRKKD